MKKINVSSKATNNVECDNCKKSIKAGEQFTFKGKDGKEIYLCKDCKVLVDDAFALETKNPNILRSVAGGLLAAVIAGIIWYFFVIITKIELGYLAIGVGYLIGWGVYLGSGKKRGIAIQLITVAITLLTLIVSSYLVYSHFVEEYLENELGKQVSLPIWAVLIDAPSDFLSSLVSPMGLLIWGIGLYVAYRFAMPRKV